MSSKPNLTNDARNNIALFLLEGCKNGNPAKGKFKQAAARYGVTTRCISTIWRRAKQQIIEGRPIAVHNKKAGRDMSKRKKHLDYAKLARVPFKLRGTIRRVATGLGVGKSTVGRWIKQKMIRPHSNAIKPILTEANKITRLKYCLNALYFDNRQNVVKFKSMQQIIHIDEKWFYLSKTTEKVYLGRDEKEPYRACKSKRFITKVMFLCAVCRPMYAPNGSLIFDGKIGIFPFINKVPAKRKSKNRTAGTMETKSMDSVTKQVTKDMLINQVIPAIKAKWPSCASKDIMIQQDNARPHIGNDDIEFQQAATSDGFNIHLVFQPPNSPDTNVLDLGWFRALQSLQAETAAKNVDELLTAVYNSFEKLTHSTLNKVFLSLQSCMVEMMKLRGHNNFRLSHMKKGTLARQGRLPTNLSVDLMLVTDCIDHLVQAGDAEDMGELMNSLDLFM